MKLLIPCCLALILGSCAFDSIGFGLSYKTPDGTEIGGTVKLDPRFVQDKK